MGLFSNKGELRRARLEAARQRALGAAAIEEVAGAKARTKSAEQARLGVFGLLGAPGTYDLPGTPTATAAGGEPAKLDTRGILYDKPGGSAAGHAMASGVYGEKFLDIWQGRQTGIIDPDAYASEISKTADFRIRSRLTAEAEQLLAREGEGWERLNQATLGQIYQGAAEARREEMRAIKNAAAKGGSARRNAFIQAQNSIVRERANTMRIEQTWKANLALDQYVKENADNVQEGNIRFLNNLPLLRDTYQNTMSNLAELMAGVAIPVASKASAAGFQARATVKDSSFLGKLITGGLSIVGGALTGGFGSSLVGAAASFIPGAEKAAGWAGGIAGSIDERAGRLGGAFSAARGTPLSSFEFSPTAGDNPFGSFARVPTKSVRVR